MASAHYWHYGKSIRATQAENEGRFPKTAFRKIYGIDPAAVTTATEWHHTSKFFNRTDYYNIEDVMQSLADMHYEERRQYLKGKFRQYWNENKFNYLTYEKPIIAENKMHGFAIYSDIIYLDSDVSDSTMWRAVRKAVADKKNNPNKNYYTYPKTSIEKSSLNKFSVSYKSVIFDISTREPVSAIISLTDLSDFKNLVFEKKEDSYIELPLTGYKYTRSGYGRTYYFTK
ncbi:MAG: hypothetical protein KF862_07110 [Chitinophagaceae bacterium]|nr:hypothetical protein [Chitinophagaceae bacterium]